MNSKEIIKKTLEFNSPERVGRTFQNSDFIWCSNTVKTYATDWVQVGESRWERTDEWGNLWARLDPNSKGEVVQGVLKNIEDIYFYEFADFSNYNDYCIAEETVDNYPEKWVIGSMPGFTFNISRQLFKMENYLCNILLEPKYMHNLHDRIDILLHQMIENYAKAGVDSIMFPEDWGTQTQLLISPQLWYEEYFPRFKKLCEKAHECGIKVFMHSCGFICEIIPGLIKAGIDLFQFHQPMLHGIDKLAVYQGKSRITFMCPVDIQKTLQTKDEQLIRSEARELLDKLWKGKGGFIADFYSDNDSIGLESKWQQYACEEFIARGKRRLYSKN